MGVACPGAAAPAAVGAGGRRSCRRRAGPGRGGRSCGWRPRSRICSLRRRSRRLDRSRSGRRCGRRHSRRWRRGLIFVFVRGRWRRHDDTRHRRGCAGCGCAAARAHLACVPGAAAGVAGAGAGDGLAGPTGFRMCGGAVHVMTLPSCFTVTTTSVGVSGGGHVATWTRVPAVPRLPLRFTPTTR